MVEKIIVGIKQELNGILDHAQLEVLEAVLNKHLGNILVKEHSREEDSEKRFLQLFIAAKRVVPKGSVIELSPSSGLLGAPTQTEFGLTGKCLLNPKIRPNTFVHIDNSLVRAREIEINQPYRGLDQDGLYRVISVNHVGDTRGDNWYTEFETITQAGMLPSMVATGDYNI